jgi:aldehyde:ferredoxin oxidoreductase
MTGLHTLFEARSAARSARARRAAAGRGVPGGYWGRLLHVDLSSRSAELLPLEADFLRATVGGAGLGAALLHRWCPPGVDPLDPANPLLFVTSPLLGTPLTTTAKYTVVTKSPLTGFVTDSLSSSFFALALKGAGADAVAITGRAEEPLWIEIGAQGVAFHGARGLWGAPAAEAARAIRVTTGRRSRVAAIGPAGERRVRFATISNDRRHAGRGGTGAVMGSKNLKAVAVHQGAFPPVADPDHLAKIASRLRLRSLGPATAKYRTLGTTANLALFNRLAALPSYNFRRSTFEGAERLSGERLAAERRVKRLSCAGCTVGCEHVFRSASGGAAGRLEYETLFALGPLVGVSDPDRVLRSAQLCDHYGIDTISAGGTVAWALEAEERGLFEAAGLGPLGVEFGDGEGVAALLEAIGGREGVGDLLAEGSLRAARAVGHGAEAFAMQVKGMELPGYEPRSLKTMALGFAIGSRGACHNRSGAYEADFSAEVDRFVAEPARGPIAAESEDRSAVLDSLVVCKFLRHCFEDVCVEGAEMLRAVTGWEFTGEELATAAERTTNLKKAFNLREGWVPEDDTLPERCLTEALPTGMAAGISLGREDLRMMIEAYYEARGWTPEGRISEETWKRLGLDAVLGEPLPAAR